MTPKERPLLLLTGSTGFIGSSYKVSNKLKSYDMAYILRDGICLFMDEYLPLDVFIVKVVSNFKNVTLVHCATKYIRADEPYCLDEVIQANVNFPCSLVEDINYYCDLSVINLNSYFQYPELIHYPDTVYTLSKKLFEKYLADKKIKHINLVIYDTFGVGDRRDKLMPNMLNAIKSKTPLIVRNGLLELALTDIGIVVDCIDYVVSQNLACSTGATYGVHQSKTIRIDNVIDIARKYHHLDININYGKPLKPTLLNLPPGFLPDQSMVKSLNTFFKNA